MKKPMTIVTTIIVLVVLSFLRAWFVLILWNYVIPPIFDLPVITYFQAFAITILTSLLF